MKNASIARRVTASSEKYKSARSFQSEDGACEVPAIGGEAFYQMRDKHHAAEARSPHPQSPHSGTPVRVSTVGPRHGPKSHAISR